MAVKKTYPGCGASYYSASPYANWGECEKCGENLSKVPIDKKKEG